MFKVLLCHKGNMKSVGKIANLFNKLYCGISNIQEFSDREMFFFFLINLGPYCTQYNKMNTSDIFFKC